MSLRTHSCLAIMNSSKAELTKWNSKYSYWRVCWHTVACRYSTFPAGWLWLVSSVAYSKETFVCSLSDVNHFPGQTFRVFVGFFFPKKKGYRFRRDCMYVFDSTSVKRLRLFWKGSQSRGCNSRHSHDGKIWPISAVVSMATQVYLTSSLSVACWLFIIFSRVVLFFLQWFKLHFRRTRHRPNWSGPDLITAAGQIFTM